jgi:hypothetical protein
MAFLDGELSEADAQVVSAHLDHCVECAGLAGRFRATSQSLSQWTVSPVPSSLEESVMTEAAKNTPSPLPAKPGRSIQLSFWNWRLWAIGGGGAVTAVLILVAFVASMMYYENHPRSSPQMATMSQSPVSGYTAPTAAQSMQKSVLKDEPSAGIGGIAQLDSFKAASTRAPADEKMNNALMGKSDNRPQAVSAPMIARTVTLSIIVKDFGVARSSLDSVLARHHGYAAQLTAATAENAPRSFQASLRIPAPDLAAAIGELRTLGRVQNESQSGEEVTQQHTDLAARLQNSRETEGRLRAILEQRTGKIDDVLQVEQEIARVRGEIEAMEAEQQALEHRVEFASVDLQLTEEYKAQLNPSSVSVSNRLHNAFVTGVRNAAETVLSVVLFLEEDGPVLLIWLAILGLPVLLLVRRYRRVRTRL